MVTENNSHGLTTAPGPSSPCHHDPTVECCPNCCQHCRRLTLLEQRWLRLSKTSLLRLQKGDIVLLQVKRPIATSESKALVQAWSDLMQRQGIEGVELMVIAGVDVDLEVVRGTAT